MKKERMLHKGLLLIVIAVLISGCGPSPEEQAFISAGQTAAAATPTQIPTPTIENLHMPFHMETSYLESTDIDRIYNLYISLPYDYQEGSSEYPVIYVLDGDILFGSVREFIMTNVEIEDSIVVGIGYDTDEIGDIFTYRYQDMDPSGINYTKFTQFFDEELIPFIESSYRVDPSDRTLVGHSLSGLYSLTFMFEHPDRFNKIISISPPLFKNSGDIFIIEEDYAEASQELPVNLYISVGSLEEDLLNNMVSNIERFSDQIEYRDYSGFSLLTEIFEGENHGSVILFSISKGIRAVNEYNED
jgi:predicted alpha/beta superfamily hydrolase